MTEVVQLPDVDQQLNAVRRDRTAPGAVGWKRTAMQIVDETLWSNVIVGLAVKQHKEHIRMVGRDSLGQQFGQNVCRTDQGGGRDELLGADTDILNR